MPRHDGSKRRVSRARRRNTPSKYARRGGGKRRAAPSKSLLDRLADVVPPEPPKVER